MEANKLNTVVVKGDKPFLKRYHILADRFFDRDEQKVIEEMNGQEFEDMANQNNWVWKKLN